MNETEEPQADTASTTRPRNPWIAAALSAILPGLGHFYAGRRLLALGMFLGYVTMANVAIAVIVFADFAPLNIALPILLIVCSYFFVIGSAFTLARRANRDRQNVTSNRWYHYVLILLIAVPLSSWVLPVWTEYEAFKVASGSMKYALMPGDYFLADMRAYRSRGPENNDIVVYRYRSEPEIRYVHRCVARPGDTIGIRHRLILINGEEYEHPATMHWDSEAGGFRRRQGGPLDKRDNMEPFVVPDDHYFVLGDNLSYAKDSRLRGPVHRDDVLGKAVRIHWSAYISRVGLATR